ncbi:MAG: hypothetical protein KDK12_19795 [Rhodobacteraceae bacterium]|nr:hypothetical protein [Paracoccaceae bacterium]
MRDGSLRNASPAWLHAFVLWSPQSADPAQFLAVADLPQLGAGTARLLFWFAAGAAAEVARYDLNRTKAAQIAGFSAPWFELFDRIGRRAATRGFDGPGFREPRLTPHVIDRRRATVEALRAFKVRGRMDWEIANSLVDNTGADFDPGMLTREERATLPLPPYGFG